MMDDDVLHVVRVCACAVRIRGRWGRAAEYFEVFLDNVRLWALV